MAKQINYTQPTINIWFPDQKEPIYNPNNYISNYQFKAFWSREKDRLINGFYIADGQVFIPGFLYWHTVYWKIAMYIEDKISGRKPRIISTPFLRDVEWDITDDFERAINEGRFYTLVGSRDFGKSILSASYAGYKFTFFDNSECVISSSEAKYIKLATNKIEDGLTNLHPIWKKQRLMSNWKEEVRAGWKDKKSNTPSDKSSNSVIYIRNYEHGNKTMAANGTRPGFHLIDEIGTLENLIGCLKDSDGSWWSGGGTKPSCLVVATGCVCAGTKVYTKEGKIINIEDLKQEDGIIGYNGFKTIEQTINWFKAPEEKECFRITTSSGNIIECSYDHPLLITKRNFYDYKNKGKIKRSIYQEAQSIQVKDQLLLPSKVDIFGDQNIPYARALGLMIGDGNCSQDALPSFSISEKEILDYLNLVIKDSFISKEYVIDGVRTFSQYNVKSKWFVEKLKEHGLYGKVKLNKRLPEDIHLFDRESLCQLIAGYFDADGNVYYNEKKKIVRVVLTSVVHELLQEVKYQFLKLGIHCCIIKEKRNKKPSEQYKGQQPYIYRLYINKQQDLEIFRDNIHLLSKNKRDKLSLIKYSKYQLFNTQFEINPLNKKEGYFDSNTLKDLRYETVTKIEPIGKQMVYNLNCSKNHNYVSSGFITRQTGGDMEVGKEAAEVFYNPVGFNMLEFDDEWENSGKIGRFVSALRAKHGFKEPKTLSEYLGISHPELDKITILVANQDRAKAEWWDIEYAKVLKTGNQKAIMKFKAYWPLVPSDAFIVLTQNDFNVEAAKAQQNRLRQLGQVGTPIELFNDGEKIRHKHSDLIPVTDFPCKRIDKDAPIMIYEFPDVNSPFGLYTCGIDSYVQDDSEYSESLGSVYIYKRMHSITSERFQNVMVASYSARPKDKKKWEEQTRLLIKYYNARTLVENDEISFINYMISKMDGHLLEDPPEWEKEFTPNRNMNRKKGVSRASKAFRDFLDGNLAQYLDEVINKEYDEKGNLVKEILGVTRIKDPMLLEEITKYNKKKGNYDRVVSFSLALALANKMDPVIRVNSMETDPRFISVQKRSNKQRTLFTPITKSFKRVGKLFP